MYNKLKIWWLICLFTFFTDTIHVFAQEIKNGKNSYITYQVGNMPLVISVPHGGAVAPASIPDRTCPNAVTVTDLNTQNIAKELSNNIFILTGCYPHIIFCNLKRSKLDCNRNITDGACGNPDAVTAWKEYHDFIQEALSNSDENHSFNSFILDIHGHGKPSQRIELGYILNEIDLENTDLVLNTAALINNSSLRNLALQNKNNLKHADLIRGPLSFGTLLYDKGYPTVPSSQIPSPAGDNTYFNGGYITANYTSYNPTIAANGFQIELNYTGIRNNTENIRKFAVAMADAIIEYMYTHRDIIKNSCQTASNITSDLDMVRIRYHQDSHSIYMAGTESNELTYEIYLTDGRVISSGNIIDDIIELPAVMSPGLYIVQISHKGDRLVKAFKFIVQ